MVLLEGGRFLMSEVSLYPSTREATMLYPANRGAYLAVGRQIKANYLWAFAATFAVFKGK